MPAEFFRECWGQRLSSHDFLARLQSRFSPEEIGDVIRFWLGLCSNAPASTLFLGYLTAYVSSDPSQVFELVDSNSREQSAGIAAWLASSGAVLFNTLPLGPASATCALRALSFLVSSPTGLKQVSRSLYFSVLVASGRVFAPELFARVQMRFTVHSVFDFSNHYGEQLLSDALMSTALNFGTFSVMYGTFLAALAAPFHLDQSSSSLLRFGTETVSSFVSDHFLAEYTNHPTLVGASIISDILPRLVSMPVAAAEFLDSMDTDLLFQTALSYPSASALILPSALIARLTTDPASIIPVCSQILLRVDDFAHLLLAHGAFLSFLQSLARLLRQLSDNRMFESAWLCFLTLFKHCAWDTGSKVLREHCQSFLRDCACPSIRYFLECFCDIESERPQTTRSSPSALPFDISVSVLNFMLETNHFASFVGSLTEPCMWLSVLVWGLKTRHPDAAALANTGIPNYVIAREGYFNLMMVLAGPERPFSGGLELPSFDAIASVIPQKLADAAGYLAESLLRPADDFAALSRVAIGWRAALAVYAVPNFVNWLVDHLENKYSICADLGDAWRAFERAGQLFLAAVENDAVKICEAIGAIRGIAMGGEVVDGEGLGRLCMMLLLALDWEAHGREILVGIFNLGEMPEQRQTARDVFVLTVLKIALFVPEMRESIPNELAGVIIRNRDWSLAVSFFLALGEVPQPL
jgi:hypothetical protein